MTVQFHNNKIQTKKKSTKQISLLLHSTSSISPAAHNERGNSTFQRQISYGYETVNEVTK